MIFLFTRWDMLLYPFPGGCWTGWQFNIAAENLPSQKRKDFQPSFFRSYVKLRGCRDWMGDGGINLLLNWWTAMAGRLDVVDAVVKATGAGNKARIRWVFDFCFCVLLLHFNWGPPKDLPRAFSFRSASHFIWTMATSLRAWGLSTSFFKKPRWEEMQQQEAVVEIRLRPWMYRMPSIRHWCSPCWVLSERRLRFFCMLQRSAFVVLPQLNW